MSDTREKILEAADELFGRMGYDAATTREIAERCRVNKALIHYHFKNKEELLACVLDRYYQKLAHTLQNALSGEESLRERMLVLLDSYVDFLSENRNFNRIVQREASGGKNMDRINTHMTPLFQLGTTLIQGVYPSTRSGEMSATQLLISFFGMTINYFTYNRLLQQLTGTDPLSAENLGLRKQHLRRMLHILVDAIEEEDNLHGS